MSYAAWHGTQIRAAQHEDSYLADAKATAECVNAQARNRGLTQFLVRGIDKVKAVATWHALAHNMVCAWRLAPA